jgi:histidinol-phosphate aminotransferase
MNAWEKNFRETDPYVPGEQPKRKDVIKLNTNENPYPPSPLVQKKLQEMDSTLFRKYPDPDASVLVSAIAGYYKVKEENVFVGVGSDDVLGTAFLTFFNGPDPVLFPDITYSFYDVWAKLFRIPFETPKLNRDFKIEKEDYYRKNGGVVIANPNAPTGIMMDLQDIEDIVKHNTESVVIIDEAYVDFGGKSALPLTEKYKNLLVVQTFSKSRSMAGMRIGFAIGDTGIISAMRRVRYSYNSYTMNMPSILLGAEAVKDDAYFRETTGRIIRTRERVKKELSALGFIFGDSMTNFIFASCPGVNAAGLFEAMKKEGIYVRYFNRPVISDYLRITIGTDEEMDVMLSFLRRYLKK